MRRVGGETVGDVEHRGRDAREPRALVEAERRPSSRPARNATPAPPSGPVTTSTSPGFAPARPGTRSARPSAVTLRQHRLRARRVAAAHGNAGLVQALVQLDDVRRAPLSPGSAERDDKRKRLGAARGEIAEVDGGSAIAEIAPRDEIEAEVHTLDERVLRHDEPVDLRGVVLDALREPAALELGEQAELSRLVEPHSSSIRTRSSSVSGSSA